MITEARGLTSKTTITEENIQSLYRTSFRTEQEQTVFERYYIDAFGTNRTVVPSSVNGTGSNCSYTCDAPGPVVERRRRGTSNMLQHGCCRS